MKKTFTGWIPKRFKNNLAKIRTSYDYDHRDWFVIWKNKGVKSDYSSEDWPPIRVKITVETID